MSLKMYTDKLTTRKNVHGTLIPATGVWDLRCTGRYNSYFIKGRLTHPYHVPTTDQVSA